MFIVITELIIGLASVLFSERAHRHREDEDLSEAAATRDVRKLCDKAHGEKRGWCYTASDRLIGLVQKQRCRAKRGDPYEIVRSDQYRLSRAFNRLRTVLGV